MAITLNNGFKMPIIGLGVWRMEGNRNISLLRSDLSDVVAVIMAPFSGDEMTPFFGFLGAVAALVFSCNSIPNFSIRSILVFS